MLEGLSRRPALFQPDIQHAHDRALSSVLARHWRVCARVLVHFMRAYEHTCERVGTLSQSRRVNGSRLVCEEADKNRTARVRLRRGSVTRRRRVSSVTFTANRSASGKPDAETLLSDRFCIC